MARGVLEGQRSQSKVIEDMIFEYTVSADGNIVAGDLCEFINGQVRKTKYETFNATTNVMNSTASMNINSILLNDNYVLVFFQYNTGSYPMIMLLKIDAGIITKVITETQVLNAAVSNMNVVKISETKALITYRLNSDTYMYGVIININYVNNSFSLVSAQKLTSIASDKPFCIQISNGRVLMLYSGTTNYYLYGIVLTISNDVIYLGTNYALGSATNTSVITGYKLSGDRVFFFWEFYTSGYNLYYGMIDVSDLGVVTYTVGSAYWDSGQRFYQTVVSCYGASKLILIEQNYECYKFLFTLRNTTSPYYTMLCPIYIYGNFNVVLDINFITATIGDGACDIVRIDNYSAYLVAYTNTGAVVKYLKITFDQITKTISVGAVNLLNSSAFGTAFNVFLLKNKKAVLVGFYSNAVGAFSCDLSENALSTKFVTKSLKPKLMCVSGAIIGSKAKFQFANIISNLSNLSPYAEYYCDNNGSLTTTVTNFYIGIALSSTVLLVKNPYYEKGGASWI